MLREMDEPPVAAHVAKAQLGGALIAVLIGLFGGVMMQLELASPGALWSAELYGRSLNLHGLTPVAVGAAPFAGVLGYLAITRLVGARRVPAPALAWVAFGIWVIGMVFTIISALVLSVDTGWTLYTPYSLQSEPVFPRIFKIVFPLAIGGSAVIYAVHLALVVGKHAKADPVRVALAAAIVVAIGGAGVVGASAAFTSPEGVWLSRLTTLVAMMFATVALGGERRLQHTLVAVGFGIALIWAVFPNLLIGLAFAGVWIALAIVGGFARPAVAFVVFGCAPAIVMRGIAAGISSDLPLHDTYFEVGTTHLNAAAIGFAALAGLHAWPVLARVPNTILVWIGGCVCSGGLLLHIYAQLGIGSRGMPRRYWDYDPQFQSGHVISIAGTAVLAVGAIVLAVAWLVGRPRRPAND